MAKNHLVMGIGNLLMGDEGVGVRVAEYLQLENLCPEAVIVDGGTGGFHLLDYFQEFDHVIVVDATTDGKTPGAVSTLHPRYSTDYPTSLSAHDIGLKDLIDALYLLDAVPRIDLVTVSIDAPHDVRVEMSAPVAAAVPVAAQQVVEILRRGDR